ncbi:MAG: cytochrome b N-terminal domain-containing protein [Chloroflexota bacterium]
MTPQPRFGPSLSLLLIPVLALGLGGILFVSTAGASPPAQATATPTIVPTFDPRRLEQPPTQNPPDQADQGSLYYWEVCMPCHGDQGQGLTDEWRASYPPEERDCWQSGCHGDNYPKNSFEIPSESGVPGIAGPGRLARFAAASDLQQYVLEAMPWGDPGATTPENAWAVTAYLMKLHGNQPEGFILTKTNASAIPLHRRVAAPPSEWPGTLALAALLGLAATGLAWQGSRERTVASLPKPNFVHHLHPPSIPAMQVRFRYTLGAGGLAVYFCLVLFVTGLLEMYYYVPTPEAAAVSIQTMTTLAPFGDLVRNLHYWSAQALVIVTTIHLLRVALTGAYAPPRRFNYLLGLGLLVFILLLDFTGYVLRWDEGIRWALVVGANLLKTIPLAGEGIYRFVIGGAQPGAAALTRFYAWHIFGLASGALLLVVWHAFRVRRDGGIALPPPDARADKSRITRFELVRREALAMAIAGIVLLLLSLLAPAPTDQPISGLNQMSGDSRAPWFFLWVQQMLKWGDPFLLGVLTPVLVVVALGLLPYLLPNTKPGELGRWFPRGNRLAQALAVLMILAILTLTVMGAFSR